MLDGGFCPNCGSHDREVRERVNVGATFVECANIWHEGLDYNIEFFDRPEAVEINKEEYIRIVALEQAVNTHKDRLASDTSIVSTAKRFASYLETGT